MEFDATFIIAVFSFIVFVFIMNKIFYAPVLKIMQERQDFVEENYHNAELIQNETNKQRQYRETELENSRNEAQIMISENSKKLKEHRSRKIAEYKNELYSIAANERDNLQKAASEAKEILKDNVVDIAKEISLKVLGSSITTDLIDKSQIKEQG